MAAKRGCPLEARESELQADASLWAWHPMADTAENSEKASQQFRSL
jgi:hypothetical protein